MSRLAFAGLLALAVLFPQRASGQFFQVYQPMIETVSFVVDNNPLLPPMLDLGRKQHIEIGFDEMSHDYHRYVYHLQHCQHDWTPSDGIFESDYLGGLNDQPIEDFEKSFNTTQIYTHYSLRLPNPETTFLISGNYRLIVYEDGGSINEPVLETRFCVYEKTMSVQSIVSSDTDVDFNAAHQQVSLNIGYGSLRVDDPNTQLHTVVMQNRRWDNCVFDPKFNIRNTNGVAVNHCRNLIFPAGNEFFKFELLDMRSANMNVEQIEWHEPFYHASLYPEARANHYRSDEDQNGLRIIRSHNDIEEQTTAEYAIVHFIFESERLPGGDVYVCGQWTNGPFDPRCKMEYNEAHNCYQAAILLKQGYYSYQLVQEDSRTHQTMGDFYETENEYITLVYFREQGGRTDRLVGYSRVSTAPPKL